MSDCAPCHLPSDGGNRSSRHILICEPFRGLLSSRWMDRWRLSAASGSSVSASSPLTEACRQTASGTIYPNSVQNDIIPSSHVPLMRRHNVLRWIRVYVDDIVWWLSCLRGCELRVRLALSLARAPGRGAGGWPPKADVPPTPTHSQATAFPRAIQKIQKLARVLQDRVAEFVYNLCTKIAKIAAQRRWCLCWLSVS